MKLLFTDIDGVFNTSHSRRARRVDGIVHHTVTRFDQMCIDLDAQVIVTSEWRKYTSLNDICTILGTTQRARFVGMTPALLGHKSRCIEAWLLACAHSPEPIAFAILDDHPAHFTPDHRHALVRVNSSQGLTDVNVAEVKTLFQKGLSYVA